MRCGLPMKVSGHRCFLVFGDPGLPCFCITVCANGWKSVARAPRSLLPQNLSRRSPTLNCCRQACDRRSSPFWPEWFWKNNGR